MSDFYKPIESVRIYKAKDANTRERAVRLYCSQSGRFGYGLWELQVRGPISLGANGYGGEGKDFIIANASVTREDLIALRAAIDAHLSEGDESEPSDKERGDCQQGVSR